MSKVAVTGGAGFLGSHLVDKLLSLGHQVFVVDDMSGGKESNLPLDKIYLYKADCRDAKKMDHFFKSWTPEVVYHLAANAAENKAQFAPIDITSRNYDAFIKVLTPFVKYGGKRFVFTSSAAVYGDILAPFKESDTPHPEDLYGITKLAIEDSLKVMAKVHGFEYVIARPHNIYGERQNMSDPYRNVVTIFINALLKGQPYYMYGNGEMSRCFSYVKDVIDALYLCGFDCSSGETYNIGSDNFYTIKALSDLLQEVSGVQIDPIMLPARPQEVKDAIVDHTKAKDELFYEDSVTLREGLEKTWFWAKKQGAVEPDFTGIEIISDKLPKNWKI